MTLVDISNWQHPWPAERAKADGVTQVIVGCQRPALARDMIVGSRNAGVDVLGVYAFLYWGTDTLGQTRSAIQVAKDLDIPWVWLDCEDSPDAIADLPVSQRITELAHCVEAVEAEELNPGIYTGGPFWMSAMGNTSRFSYLPLWYANYGLVNNATTPPIQNVSFGGWKDVAIHQFTSQYPAAGLLLDANYNFMEDDMAGITREEFDALRARCAQLETQVWGTPDVPRDKDHPYAGLNMYELSAGRVAKGAPDHTHEVTVTLQ